MMYFFLGLVVACLMTTFFAYRHEIDNVGDLIRVAKREYTTGIYVLGIPMLVIILVSLIF